MNPSAKLVAFLAVLAAVFGVSYLAGVQSQALLAPAPTHNSEMGLPTSTVEGYEVSVVQPTQQPGKDVPVELAVTAPDGEALSWLGEDSGEPLHLIALRRDLTGYQHLMAQQGEGTAWWGILDLTPGPWHVIIYFRSQALDREITLASDFMVSGEYRPEPLPPAANQVEARGLTATLEAGLTTRADSSTAVTVTDSGQPVTDLQPAHGALGHAIVISPADLGYLHLHSTSQGSGPRLDFAGSVPDKGSYRMFVEFYRAGEPYQVEFTAQVTR
ncbi:MAG TPA: hypothetical protein VJN19_13030 [Propionibacteriaceae bacterium]|jgi:hypothetical protein|nr:hypothetical protein [Propionibacteriaceae bacterium]